MQWLHKTLSSGILSIYLHAYKMGF